MVPRALSACLLGALLAGCVAAKPQGCRVETVADLPLLPHADITTVAATLEGQKVALLIDTGAFISTISRNGAQQLGVRPGGGGYASFTRIQGVGGVTAAPIVTVHDLSLGRGVIQRLHLPLLSNFSRPVDGLPVVGSFGDDFLSNYDVDVDLPRQHFGLYKATGCDARMEPFDPPYFEIPFRKENGNIVLNIRLNDRPITAVLDTGASLTVIDRKQALAAGVVLDGLNADQIQLHAGVDLRPIEMRRHQFGSLEVGDERMNNFRFEVADLAAGKTLLGRDFLRFNHVLISYSRRMLFIQPAIAGAADLARRLVRNKEPDDTALVSSAVSSYGSSICTTLYDSCYSLVPRLATLCSVLPWAEPGL